MSAESFARLWSSLSARRQAQMMGLLAFTLVASAAEVFSVGAVLPFLAVLTAPEKVFAHAYAQPLIARLGVTEPQGLLWPVTALFCVAALVAAAVRITALWLRTRVAFATGADLSVEVYRRTLYQPYAVHLARNSSEVIDAISGKVNTVIFSVLGPLMIVASNAVALTVILLALLLYEPMIALVTFSGLGLIYLTIYRVSRARLHANSQHIALNSTHRIKTLQEGLGGIRDVLLDHTQSLYCDEYQRADRRMRQAQAHNAVTGEAPRSAVEALGVCLIAVVAYALARQPEGFSVALPVVGTVAIAAQRMLPLLQQLYHALTSLSGSAQSLQDTLALLEQPLPSASNAPSGEPLTFDQAIECRDLGFRYRPGGPWALQGLSLRIVKGRRIGFIGTTGCGKSTLLDILMGLLQPTQGELLVDGQSVTAANAGRWQRRIAHVPQAIYLSDASIAANIAFAVPPHQIDMARVRCAAQQAQMAQTIEAWPLGYDTVVGERGVRLSGGQRQRIGIARALYKRADVLILDEATSALDSLTERDVMQAIKGLGKELTILMVAHRVTTLQGCDEIVELAAGRVRQVTPYAEIAHPHLPQRPASPMTPHGTPYGTPHVTPDTTPHGTSHVAPHLPSHLPSKSPSRPSSLLRKAL